MFTPTDLARIEATTVEIGREIFDRCAGRGPSIWQRQWWDDRVMQWGMHDDAVKVQMFRFIDVLPMLADGPSITRHMQEYFHEVRERLPAAVRMSLAVATPESLAGRALAMVARRNALGSARRFIAGTTAAEVLAAAMRQRKLRRAFTLDILGEAVTSEIEADRYLQMYLDLVAGIAPTVNAWPEVAQIDRAELAPLPRVNVSIKLSALDSQFDPIDPEGTTRRVAHRLRQVLRVCRQHGSFLHVDMESYRTKQLTLRIFQSVLSEDEFRDTSDVGIVIQCYLHEAERDLASLRDWAQRRARPVWVRLVKGAYWDYETVFARQQGWPIPVYQQKWESDACFERAARFLMLNRAHLRPALASHNIRSLAHGLAVARQLGVSPSSFEVQMLYGMADAEKQALVDMGYRVRVYMPYGDLLPGMAYLVRRLLENTSNDSFLKAGFSDHVSPEVLLMNPQQAAAGRAAVDRAGHGAASRSSTSVPAHFANEPHTDFAIDENREAFAHALAHVGRLRGRHEPLWIAGQQVETAERLASHNPSHFRQVVGTTAAAGPTEVHRAVAAARDAAAAWSALGVEARAALLERIAERMHEQRFELAAWQVYECGKGWREADADVAEAIDFCRYYAREGRALEDGGVDVPGEENRFTWMPRGVTAVIAPWNFPLAILTGMTAAALVTGNTVVMKPAEQAPIVAARLMDILREVGLPPGVVGYLPGRGEQAGAALVEHPDVAIIAFTGSRAVGLHIHRRAAEVSAGGLPYVKRVIAEMGGKNGIIVDDDADLDEAVLGVVHSAFGYQGQKCSACSRVIVLERVYTAFVERLVEATRSLQIGPAEEPATRIGPVIDAESMARCLQYIALGHEEGQAVLATDVGPLGGEGYYVGPHIFVDILPSARLAQEEVFGPVLAVIRARDLDEAIDLLNGTEYGLTAGLFSRSPAHLERARRELHVGNLYLNRAITGAMVGRQPFGGFKLSGIGSKAGGAEYLWQFVLPRTITENTLRRGFAPEPEVEAE